MHGYKVVLIYKIVLGGRKKSDRNWPYFWAKIYGIDAPLLLEIGNSILATK